MATIRKRKGQYQVQIRRNGQPHYSKTFSTKRHADNWALRQELSIESQEFDFRSTDSVTLGELFERYQQEITPRKRGADQEKWRINRLKRDRIAQFSVSKLTPSAVREMRDRRMKDGIRACQYDMEQVRHVIEIARREWGYNIPSNPVDLVKKPHGNAPRKRRLCEGEWQRLERECHKTRVWYLWPLISLAVNTAMRRGELLGLRQENIDLKSKVLTYPKQKTVPQEQSLYLRAQ